MGDGLEVARPQPALRLLVDHFPAGDVVRQHAPVRPRTRQPALAMLDRTQVVFELQRVRRDQAQIGRGKRPLIAGDIGGIGLAYTHTPNYPTPTSSS